jgi:Na+-driven multidrug efflux pump
MVASGRGDMDDVSKIAALGQIAAAILGVCAALPLILFPVPILRLVGAQEDVIGSASEFFPAGATPNLSLLAMSSAATQ